ncbi:GH36-type glycosyl hydrolase domain-containing protein [Clostridium gasigenes]|uniref:Cellobiose phosphorylase n=1 Tax=Clostridium gasigenes TaxID=94869 RepID=A0A1H0PR27_9CLOT|nr:glucoamylase family protein [Clostridium gasigenes]SDP07582.1 Cellobiose phosphorylase [Clostridium gasigenes]
MNENNSLICRKAVLLELKEAFSGILHNHKYLNKLAKQGEEIAFASEWLLDNIYLIEKEYKAIKVNLPLSYFNNLPMKDNDNRDCPRIYYLAKDYVIKNQAMIKEEELIKFIKNTKIDLTMGELWAFPLMIRIALIINLAGVTSKMVLVQKQREGATKLANIVVDAYDQCKVEALLLKLSKEYPIKNNKISDNDNEISFIGDDESLHDGLFSAEFIEKFFKILRDNSIEDERIFKFGLDRLQNKDEDSIKKAFIKEQMKEASIETSIGSTISSLRVIESINWKKFFDKTSEVEKLLMKDPSETYKKMEFSSRDYYRHKVEELSRKFNTSEKNIVNSALKLSMLAMNEEKEKFKAHVGYYLIDEGDEILAKEFSYKGPLKLKMSISKYLGIIALITLAINLGVILLIYGLGAGYTKTQYIIAFLIMLIPASEITITLFNWSVVKIRRPAHIPKLDYTKAINESNKTIVVIPTILSSVNRTKELLKELEVYYLANKCDGLYFVLLGDFKDSNTEENSLDKEINEEGLRYVKVLNKKYANSVEPKFFFLNRKRIYNKKEKVFMGYERKRGKLMEFMELLKGEKETSYTVISSDIEGLKNAKYIITLDADTILPMDAAKKMVGAMSHILNTPLLKDGKIVRGYGVMQPKVGITLESKDRTQFSKIFGAEAGIDGYSTASSDTYQDLFGEGSFTGKGILDIDVFYEVLKNEIPENKVLSHDLLEGCYARCGLLTDVEVIDGYPAFYESSCLRLHRWVRGDWQLLRWMGSSKLSALSKWKIFDNLRRSLLAPSLLIGLILTLTVLKGAEQVIMLLLFAAITPLVFTIIDFVVTPKNKLMGTFKSLKQIVLIISFIPYQSYLMIDAIFRTLFRLVISKKNLLQWKTAEEAEKSVKNTLGGYYRRMWISLVMAVLILILAFNNYSIMGIVSIPLVVLWIFAPFLAYKISEIGFEVKEYLEEDDENFLRSLSRSIWAYYEDFVNEENNFLPPDNYQEKPFKGIAHRTSPTNIGMGLISNIMAYDLGYITMGEVINRLEEELAGMRDLEKYKGHYLNWYDTKNKSSLWPRYVSTVDSGNLLGYLWIIKETLNDFKNKPLIKKDELKSLKDSYSLIREEDNSDIEDSLPDEIDVREYKEILESELVTINNLLESYVNEEKDTKEHYWINKSKIEAEMKLDFYESIFGGIEKIVKDTFMGERSPSIIETKEFLNKIKDTQEEAFTNILEKRIKRLDDFEARIEEIISEIQNIMDAMNFKSLFNEERGLFSIGYNLEEDSLGDSYYDLMASEARTASFLAIARGEVPKSHWYNLSRNMTKAFGQKSLVSWSGTMFEYFMPFQIMKSYKETLLDVTYNSVIEAQKDYASNRKTPWGISESAYYEFDVDQNYQYKAFGVPGIGLKRGLEDEVVISPYSTIMTLPYKNDGAIDNLRAIKSLGALGKYGFIEALDYTAGRALKGESEKEKEVRCYMVHHLGMSLMALDNVLNNNILQERFHNIPEIKATELLLKERVSNNIIFEREVDINNPENKIEKQYFVPRIFEGTKSDDPEILLLSNGSYSTMITQNGSGYSKKDDMTVYRWKGDSTTDSTGMFFYIKDQGSKEYWSATYEPCKKDWNYNVEFTLDKAKFQRKDKNIETNYEVVLSTEDDVEIRKLTFRNTGEDEKNIEITSYLEVTLASFEADVVHPGFSNLFINTEFDEETQSLIGNRRARSKEGKTPYILNKIVVDNLENSQMSYETSRINFIGRGRDLKSPEVMDNDAALSNTTGIVLDPIMSLRTKLKIKAGEECEIYYITAVGESKNEVLNLQAKYSNTKIIEKVSESYNYSSQLELKYIGVKSAQANIYQRLASNILFLNSGRENRETFIKDIKLNQENLWAYGISGDLPIVMLVVNNEDDIDLVAQVVNMHFYWRAKGLKVDLIIYNEEEISYEEPLQKSIGESIRNSNSRDNLNKPAGIFIHNKATMGEEIKFFLIGIARLFIDSKNGTLVNQIGLANDDEPKNYLRHKELYNVKGIRKQVSNNIIEEENIEEPTQIKKVNTLKNTKHKTKLNEEKLIKQGNHDFDEKKLDFFNGYGGFNREKNSYVIKLKNYENTPAPWINVISNEDFGFHISEAGASYTWCGNSRENKITPWSNDWVIDPLGEALYIRDDNTGEYFSITPKPIRDGGEYIIEHSFGYSTFRHTAYNISGVMTAFSPKGEKLKLYKVTLENLSSVDKELSLFYYAQLVLGVHNYESSKYISTYIQGNYIGGQNPFSKYFGKLKAYLSIKGGDKQSFTGDRKEFIGIGGDLSTPRALKYEMLSNNSGGILDPCLAASTKIKLKSGEKRDLVIILGQEEEENLIEERIEKYNNISEVDNSLENVKQYWSNFLGNIQVKTPDPSMDYMLNGWLMYQTLSCRYLARTAFYQSGGAYGFRDQLQDSISIGILNPKVTREQILRSASRQYVEGDVQHWWHPVINSGIRTRFSDDLLWLPYVLIGYIESTGDYDILKEKVSYLEDEPLREGEDERYTIVNKSNKEGTIYEHCLKAIDRALKFGEHNIPLMGSGDWNDGMSTVGNKGKGESVWLGWFLYKILDGFTDICEKQNDNDKKEEYLKFQEFIKENQEKNGWDGDWYRRAYFDDGTPLGSKENDECKIDSLAQSWSIISGAANKERSIEAMKSVDKYLVNKDKGMIMLLSPPFNNSNLEPGYIKGYVPGVRENGGQYTHAAVWVILALTKLGMGDKAWQYYNMINPINHSNTEREARNYKVEPYVMAADVYIKEPHGGRGGWSWYTGASGWMYKVGLEDILGLRKVEGKGYEIKPCVPNDWNEYEIDIKEEDAKYHIKVIRGAEKGISINGKKIVGSLIPKTKGEVDVIVII